MANVKTPAGYSVPAKYVAGLTGAERTKRLKQLDEMRKKGRKLGSLAGDKTVKGKPKKTPESPYTKAYRRRFAKDK